MRLLTICAVLALVGCVSPPPPAPQFAVPTGANAQAFYRAEAACNRDAAIFAHNNGGNQWQRTTAYRQEEVACMKGNGFTPTN